MFKKLFCIFRRLGAWNWVLLYLGVILAFAGLYSLLPGTAWKGDGHMNSFIDSLYFSVVTITSLGFGDIYPCESTFAKILVSVEAVGGILIIGFFLNYVAQKQAARLDEQNKEAEEAKKERSALDNLKTFSQILTPVFERYLRGVYMMVTPMEKKFNMPKDIFHHDFNFEYKDLCNIYEQSVLMSSDFYEPAIEAHFKNQDIVFEELRFFVTHAELCYWPDLRKMVYDFIALHHQFQVRDIIINNRLRVSTSGKKLKDFLTEEIAKTEKAPEFKSGNMFSPYVALYHFTKGNVSIIKGIHEMIEQVLNSEKSIESTTMCVG